MNAIAPKRYNDEGVEWHLAIFLRLLQSVSVNETKASLALVKAWELQRTRQTHLQPADEAFHDSNLHTRRPALHRHRAEQATGRRGGQPPAQRHSAADGSALQLHWPKRDAGAAEVQPLLLTLQHMVAGQSKEVGSGADEAERRADLGAVAWQNAHRPAEKVVVIIERRDESNAPALGTVLAYDENANEEGVAGVCPCTREQIPQHTAPSSLAVCRRIACQPAAIGSHEQMATENKFGEVSIVKRR